MKGVLKLKIIKSIKKLTIGIYASFKRFPISLLYSTCTAIMIIIINEIDSNLSRQTYEMLTRITMTLALGIPLSLCVKMFLEKRGENSYLKHIIYYIFVGILQVVFYNFLLKELNMVTISRYVGLNLTFYLCFLYIPHWLDKKNFEFYVIHILTYFLVTYVYSAVLFGGLSAILFAIDKLLGITVKSETYFYTFLIVALVFAPAYFLAYIPQGKDISLRKSYSKILKILLTYIVMPLLSIYSLILYIYFGKIIITMTWPEGLVSHLVLWFSLLLTMVLFFISPIREDTKWILKFSKWSPRIILPILIMMFVSMGIRINAYGITENRYYVLVLGLWIFGIMVYLSLSKKSRNIVLPISLSIIILISLLGPLSSYSISKYSQSKRFESILSKNKMLESGKIIPSPNIKIEDKQSISSILSYFENNHDLNNLSVLPKEFKIQDMEDTFGFDYQSPYLTYNHYFHYSSDMSEDILNISDYDYLIDSRNLYSDDPIENKDLVIDIDLESNNISIEFIDSGDIYKKNLNDFGVMIYERYGNEGGKDSLSEEEMTIEDEYKGHSFKFIFQSFNGGRDKNGQIEINDINYYLLIKK